MQKKLMILYRVFLGLLAVALVWSVWASLAQESTNTAARTSVEVAGKEAGKEVGASAAGVTAGSERKKFQTPEWVERLARDLPFLRYEWLGNELWKYLFSLLYIFLAFYVS
ncbi:MAG: hypothetical protein RMK20_16455, partial [Verrucomicrobiales bacterium]|nr:hypothetical protein [Verrucomicrobiales bacterium]